MLSAARLTHTHTHSAPEQNRSANCSDLIFNRSVKLTLLSITYADNIIYCPRTNVHVVMWTQSVLFPSRYHRWYFMLSVNVDVHQWRLFSVFILTNVATGCEQCGNTGWVKLLLFDTYVQPISFEIWRASVDRKMKYLACRG